MRVFYSQANEKVISVLLVFCGELICKKQFTTETQRTPRKHRDELRHCSENILLFRSGVFKVALAIRALKRRSPE